MNTITKQKLPFTQIGNDLLNSDKISLKAKGLYSFMSSKPDGWNFTIKSMSSQLKEGMDSIKTALQELKNEGWIQYTKNNNGTGKYHIFCTQNNPNPKVENPLQPKVENPYEGKSTRINNKDSYSNKDIHTCKYIKKFTFTLSQIKSISATSQEYKLKLKEFIDSHDNAKNLSYEDFCAKCEYQGRKYKNFKLAYEQWSKRDSNKVATTRNRPSPPTKRTFKQIDEDREKNKRKVINKLLDAGFDPFNQKHWDGLSEIDSNIMQESLGL